MRHILALFVLSLVCCGVCYGAEPSAFEKQSGATKRDLSSLQGTAQTLLNLTTQIQEQQENLKQSQEGLISLYESQHQKLQNTAPHRRKGAMPTTPAPYADSIGTGRKQSYRKPHDGSRPSVTRSAPATADRRPPTDGAPIYSGRRAIDMRPAATMTDKKIPRPKRSRDFSHGHLRMYPSAHYAVL